MFDSDTGKKLSELSGHKELILAISLSCDGKRLISGGMDQYLILWDCEKSKKIQKLIVNNNIVCLSWS